MQNENSKNKEKKHQPIIQKKHQQNENNKKSIFVSKHANDTEYKKYGKYEKYHENHFKNRNDDLFVENDNPNNFTVESKQQSKNFNSSAIPFNITNFKINSQNLRDFVKQAYNPPEDEMDEMSSDSIKENFNLIYQLLNPINYPNPRQNAKEMKLEKDNYLYNNYYCNEENEEEESLENLASVI